MRALQELAAVDHVEGQPGIAAQVTAGDRDDVRIGIDRVQCRRRIHAGQQPRGAVTGASAELEEPATGLRGRQDREQRADLRLRRHGEAARRGVGGDAGDRGGVPPEVSVVHQESAVKSQNPNPKSQPLPNARLPIPSANFSKRIPGPLPQFAQVSSQAGPIGIWRLEVVGIWSLDLGTGATSRLSLRLVAARSVDLRHRRPHRPQVGRDLPAVVHDVEQKAPGHRRGRALLSEELEDAVPLCRWSEPSHRAAISALCFSYASSTSFIVAGIGGGAHSALPLSSASMIIFSSQTICQAISRAVRDFGSGR